MVKIGRDITRRRLIQRTGASVIVGAAGNVFMPYISRAADRPMLTHGIQSGDVSPEGAMVWARADRPARIKVEFATTESFKDILGSVFADALPESDLTAKVGMADLPAGQEIFYRVVRAWHRQRAGHRALPQRSRRQARRQLLLVRRYVWPGLGHR